MRIVETQSSENTKTRNHAKDSVETSSHSDWTAGEQRIQRVRSLEQRLDELRGDRRKPVSNTPVFKNKQAAFTAWVGSVASEQDVVPRQSSFNIVNTYDKIAHIDEK